MKEITNKPSQTNNVLKCQKESWPAETQDRIVMGQCIIYRGPRRFLKITPFSSCICFPIPIIPLKMLMISTTCIIIFLPTLIASIVFIFFPIEYALHAPYSFLQRICVHLVIRGTILVVKSRNHESSKDITQITMHNLPIYIPDTIFPMILYG